MCESYEWHILFLFYYLKDIPVSDCTDVCPIWVLLISTGIVTLAPVSLPSTVNVVNNLELLPNNDVLLSAIKLIELPPAIVWLNADLDVVGKSDANVPPKLDNNLLSAIVYKYPLGSDCALTSLKLSVEGFTSKDAPKFNVILGILVVTIGNLEVPEFRHFSTYRYYKYFTISRFTSNLWTWISMYYWRTWI